MLCFHILLLNHNTLLTSYSGQLVLPHIYFFIHCEISLQAHQVDGKNKEFIVKSLTTQKRVYTSKANCYLVFINFSKIKPKMLDTQVRQCTELIVFPGTRSVTGYNHWYHLTTENETIIKRVQTFRLKLRHILFLSSKFAHKVV